jgi:hypothetical protein
MKTCRSITTAKFSSASCANDLNRRAEDHHEH